MTVHHFMTYDEYLGAIESSKSWYAEGYDEFSVFEDEDEVEALSHPSVDNTLETLLFILELDIKEASEDWFNTTHINVCQQIAAGC
jgi:hypothetical protein